MVKSKIWSISIRWSWPFSKSRLKYSRHLSLEKSLVNLSSSSTIFVSWSFIFSWHFF